MRIYSTENSEEPGNIGYNVDSKRLNWQHEKQQSATCYFSKVTTERYLRLTITDLKEAHRKFHPREQQQRRKEQRP
jgi:hypothetical protein